MLTPFYTPLGYSAAPDVYGAFQAFIAAYGLPAFPAENVFRGWQDWSASPPDFNEFAVITILGTTRRGATVDEMPGANVADDEPERYSLRTMYEVTVQVEVCSETDVARQRSYSLETCFRSFVGVSFFQRYGITAQYCSAIREMPDVDGVSQTVRRYALDFTCEYWAGVDVGSAWFNDVKIDRIEDVDAFYPPKEET
ncbi:MAG: hypothetical protein LIP77_03570 [Planctomycetes bacterium]|nr:hypothetical protein [Planctomycetota bacterium]